MSHVSDLADRIVAIDWEPASFGSHTDSRLALMREYLRRAAWWADHYQAGDDWPFFDIAAVVDPGVRAAKVVLERVAPSLEWAGIDPRPRNSCVSALHFAALLDARVELPDLPHPFDPLIVMYERGGYFMGSKSGGLEIDLCTLLLRTLQDHLITEPRVSLATAELDAIDARDG